MALLVFYSSGHLLEITLSSVLEFLVVIISLLLELSFNELVFDFLLAGPPELSNMGESGRFELKLSRDIILLSRQPGADARESFSLKLVRPASLLNL